MAFHTRLSASMRLPVGLCLLTISSVSLWSSADASADDKALEVLTALVGHYAQLESMQTEMKATINIDIPDFGEQNMSSTFAVAARPPNAFALRGKEGMFTVDVVNNGTELYMYIPMLNSYTIQEGAASFAEIQELESEANMIPGADMIMNFLDEESRDELLDAADAAVYVGIEEIKGTSVHHITMQQDVDVDVDEDEDEDEDLSFTVNMWISAEGDPWVMRIIPDMKAMMEAQGDAAGMPAGMEMELVIDFSNWSSDPLDDSAFAFDPPEGARKVDDLMEDMAFEDDADAPDFEIDEEEPEMPGEGKPAPAFEAELLDGSTFVLANTVGKNVVVLDFWATWCPPCRRGLPILAKVTGELADRGVVFIAVDLRETNEKVTKFLAKQDYSLTVAMDRDGKIGESYGVGGIPHTVIIGRDGIIAHVHIGFSPDLEEKLHEELAALLDEGA